MGTSKSYSTSATGQPQWGDLSRVVTTNCNGGNVTTANLGKIVGNYVNVLGGASRAGRGGSKIGGRSGIKTGKRLGGVLGFFTSSNGDLRQTLSQTGLTDLNGKTVADIVNYLIEYCSGPASNIDDRAAKEASRILLEELTTNANSIDELEAKLKENLDSQSLEEILVRYFGYYIIEHLSVMFYEKLVTEKGKTDCTELFRQIKNFIHARLEEMNKTNPLQNMDWGSDDADRAIKNIYQDVLTVFENHES
jgi:hypothetical protein